MTERNTGYIGNGEYAVYYTLPNSDSVRKFVGICENFSTNLSAFWNEENETMLLVQYSDIKGLYPLKSN